MSDYNYFLRFEASFPGAGSPTPDDGFYQERNPYGPFPETVTITIPYELAQRLYWRDMEASFDEEEFIIGQLYAQGVYPESRLRRYAAG